MRYGPAARRDVLKFEIIRPALRLDGPVRPCLAGLSFVGFAPRRRRFSVANVNFQIPRRPAILDEESVIPLVAELSRSMMWPVQIAAVGCAGAIRGGDTPFLFLPRLSISHL